MIFFFFLLESILMVSLLVMQSVFPMPLRALLVSLESESPINSILACTAGKSVQWPFKNTWQCGKGCHYNCKYSSSETHESQRRSPTWNLALLQCEPPCNTEGAWIPFNPVDLAKPRWLCFPKNLGSQTPRRVSTRWRPKLPAKAHNKHSIKPNIKSKSRPLQYAADQSTRKSLREILTTEAGYFFTILHLRSKQCCCFCVVVEVT